MTNYIEAWPGYGLHGEGSGKFAHKQLPVAAHKLSDVEQLAFELRTLHRRIGDVSWALDEGLSAVRKAAGGYRQPDPSTGRPLEFEGIDPDVLARRVLRAARLVRALEGISLE